MVGGITFSNPAFKRIALTKWLDQFEDIYA
jgi:hypothetical protein